MESLHFDYFVEPYWSILPAKIRDRAVLTVFLMVFNVAFTFFFFFFEVDSGLKSPETLFLENYKYSAFSKEKASTHSPTSPFLPHEVHSLPTRVPPVSRARRSRPRLLHPVHSPRELCHLPGQRCKKHLQALRHWCLPFPKPDSPGIHRKCSGYT